MALSALMLGLTFVVIPENPEALEKLVVAAFSKALTFEAGKKIREPQSRNETRRVPHRIRIFQSLDV